MQSDRCLGKASEQVMFGLRPEGTRKAISHRIASQWNVVDNDSF